MRISLIRRKHLELNRGFMAFLATEDRFGPELDRYRQGEPVRLQLVYYGGHKLTLTLFDRFRIHTLTRLKMTESRCLVGRM